ncbi:MAG TPA: DUF3298 and DUF4163 domain-containing protein [Edaphocola sp.]|nr:DUF3298 and DUF4163 domain-containing protein [Edaphocola sp.]
MNLQKLTVVVLLALLCNVRTVQAQDARGPRVTFYKTFTGTIAGQPVIMQWGNLPQNSQLYYEYLEYRQRIPLVLVPDSSSAGRLFFSEGLDDDGRPVGKPVWKCRYDQGRIAGTWYSADRKKNYPVLLKEETPQGVQAFTYQSIDTTVFLFSENTTDDRSYDLEYSAPLALGDSETADWVNRMIKKGQQYNPDLSLLENFTLRIDSNSAEYQVNRDNARDDSSGIWRWEMNNDVSVDYNQDGYVILLTSGYQYSGGAHGGAWDLFECLDVENKKVMVLSDIVSADSNVLEKMLEQQFREDYQLKATDSLTEYLFENKLMPNGNFSFDGSGLYFTYNQYEVAPYVMGIISVMIPWEKLKPYLNREFSKRMRVRM